MSGKNPKTEVITHHGARAMRRKSVANTAPPAVGTEPLVTSAEALRTLRQNKHNPLPYLKPEMLARVLDQFEHGHLREACLLWEKIAERDDVIASVKPKREKDVSQLDMQVVVSPDAGADGEEHKNVLERFWKNVRCVNSYDRNERGGFRRLVKQMMTAVSYRYAAHHIIWQPRPDGDLRATFEFVPLWMFENRAGRLRYMPSLASTAGDILADGEWMVTTGDGLMISCSIGYLAKRSAFNDWLVFSEKFSVPGVMGRTTAKKGSAEANAMKAAVESFGHDWMAVIYGDDGTHAKPIELIQAQGSPQGMPMPAVVERVDRKFAALYRGADLSSMSSNQGDGTGASLQEKETDILRRDDAETIAETLEEVSRMVIEWHYGNGVEPLARVELVVPVQEDTSKVIEAGIKLAEKGARVSVSALMERVNVPEAKDNDDVLGGQKPDAGGKARFETRLKTDLGQEALANSDVPEDLAQRLTDALSSDLQPLGEALAGALQGGDGAAVQAALRKISAHMPEFLQSEAMEELMANEAVSALLGSGEEVENGDFKGHPFRGNQHRGWSREGETKSLRDQLGPMPEKGGNLDAAANRERLHAAISRCLSLKRDVPRAAFREGLGQVDLPYGRPGNPAIGYADGYGASHIVEKHGKQSFNAIPDIIATGAIHKHDRESNKRYVTLGTRLVIMGRKDARHSWVISSFEDTRKTNQIQGG